MDIRILPAMHGDRSELSQIKSKGEFIDLLIITHIDDDHIGGICRWFEDSKFEKTIIKKVWFNSKKNIVRKFRADSSEVESTVKLNMNTSSKKSVKQGCYLEDKLEELNIWIKDIIVEKYEDEIGECKIKVLSPGLKGLKKLSEKWESEEYKNTKKAKKNDYKYSIEELYLKPDVEDDSIPNESSIAILIEYRSSKVLLLGDAKSSVIEAALKNMGYDETNRIKLNLLKVSHHGSKKNISKELLKIIDCNNYAISTDSQRYGLPDKECMSKIIMSNTETSLYFNYDYVKKKRIFSEEEYEKYNFRCNILKSDERYEIGKEIYIWK